MPRSVSQLDPIDQRLLEAQDDDVLEALRARGLTDVQAAAEIRAALEAARGVSAALRFTLAPSAEEPAA